MLSPREADEKTNMFSRLQAAKLLQNELQGITDDKNRQTYEHLYLSLVQMSILLYYFTPDLKGSLVMPFEHEGDFRPGPRGEIEALP